MNDNTAPARAREIQRDARAWSTFSGMKYTRALRLMEHPLAQGILGDRICSRDVIRVLTEHPVLSEPIWDVGADGNEFQTEERVTHLGDGGLYGAEDRSLGVSTEEDYLGLILTAEVLRAFTRTDVPTSDAYSYNLKHTAEEFLGEHLREYSYVSNGQVIWAAAMVGIPLAESNPGAYSLNADMALVREQVDYARRTRRSAGAARDGVRAHHHRPPGYLFLQRALAEHRDSGATPGRWNGVDDQAEPLTSPFHEWLIAPAAPARDNVPHRSRERFTGDYAAGVRDGEHGIARRPEDLLAILHTVGGDLDSFDMARDAVLDWARTSPLSTGIRTELLDSSRDSHDGWGAGDGDTERLEFRCPCGRGLIVEEHDNIPGFREHGAWIQCETCRDEWDFVPGLSTDGWRVQPIAALAT